MDVVTLEPGRASGDTAERVHRVRVAALAVDEPAAPPPAVEDTAALLSVRRNHAGSLHHVARVGGEVVGYAGLGLPGRDNAHAAFLSPVVHPGRRRRGVGTELLRSALEVISAQGRRTLLIEADEGTPGAAFCDAYGLENVLADRSSVLVLSRVDWTDAGTLAAGDHPGYRLVGWEDGCPPHLVDSYARAKAAMNDAPLGAMDWQGLTYSADRIRDDEAVARQLGQQWRVVAAVHDGTGEVAAFTEVGVSRWSPRRAAQDDTAVVPAHRGSGLGLWVKAEMLRRLRADRPDVTEIETRNSVANDHMWRINDRLGFRPYATTCERQARVDDLAARLAARPSTAAGQRR